MPTKKVLIIGHVWPEPKTTAAGRRMMQLLLAFKEQGYHIVFSTTAAKTDYSEDLSKLGLAEVPIKLNHPSFDVFIQKLQPDLVIFDRFMVEEQFGWRVAANTPKAIRVLNTEDLHSLRQTRQACVKKNETFTLAAWKSNDVTKREIASMYRSDLTLLVSSYEMEVLKTDFGMPQELLLYLPFMIQPLSKEAIVSLPNFGERKHFVCFGNGRHAPNVDSIHRLKNKLWPMIRKKLPNAQLRVYGAYLPEAVHQFHKPEEGFYVEGWVDDLDAVLQNARLNLAPLRFGAGIKGKLIDAMRNGLPSVTTSIGAEGMHADLPWAGAIADEDLDFVQKTVALYGAKTEWETAQQHGFSIINNIYDHEKQRTKLFTKLENLAADLQRHREQNFTGQMIRHQNMAATKYMGKWIEEKNRKK